MDLSLISLIVSSITAVGTIIIHLHLRRVDFCCMSSDCHKTPPSTPAMCEQQPLIR